MTGAELPRRFELRGLLEERALVRGALILGVGAGLAVGLAPARWDVILLLAVAVVVIAAIGALLRGPVPVRAPRAPLNGRQVLALLALYLVLASTLVFRQRTANELADDPLDLAGQFRVIALGGAFVVACVSMLSRSFNLRRVPVAGWLVVAYVAVVPLAIPEAVSVSLVLFKWTELVTFVVVWLALTRAFPDDTAVPLRHVGIAIGLELTAVLAGIVLYPGQTVLETGGILSFQLQGHLPQVSANEVGTLGLVVVAFGLGRERVNAGLIALGVAVVLAAQYRTGYITLLAMVVVVLVLRRHVAARALLVVLAVVLPIAAQTDVIEQAWLRNETSAATITTLTGRTIWWGEAIDVADRSPIVGVGLSSGVRYEVLQARFNGFTSTIHSTWVEAYVGTGLVGVSLLAAALLLAIASALQRVRWDGALLPITLLTLISVKSITSSTMEIGGQMFLLFLLAVSAAADRPTHAPPVPGDHVAGRDQAVPV